MQIPNNGENISLNGKNETLERFGIIVILQPIVTKIMRGLKLGKSGIKKNALNMVVNIEKNIVKLLMRNQGNGEKFTSLSIGNIMLRKNVDGARRTQNRIVRLLVHMPHRIT